MEESEWYSSEIDVEDENGDPKNSEPGDLFLLLEG